MEHCTEKSYDMGMNIGSGMDSDSDLGMNLNMGMNRGMFWDNSFWDNSFSLCLWRKLRSSSCSLSLPYVIWSAGCLHRTLMCALWLLRELIIVGQPAGLYRKLKCLSPLYLSICSPSVLRKHEGPGACQSTTHTTALRLSARD